MKRRARRSTTRAFTLIELMLVMGMMAILAAAVGMALAQAMEQGRASRTQAQIARIHALLMTRYDGYRTRNIRIPSSYLPPNATAQQRAMARLAVIRETMRLEMPQCVGDIVDIDQSTNQPILTSPAERTSALLLTGYPAFSRNYFRRVQAHPNFVLGGAIESECLYLILSTIQEGDTNGLDFLLPSEIGDTDGDGVPEVLDAWGRPIMFLRWAPGYVNNSAFPYPVDTSLQNGTDPDPFDPLRVDNRGTYLLMPLVCSAGPDAGYGLVTPNLDYEESDPFHFLNPPALGGGYAPHGTALPVGGDEFWRDNITNHALSRP